MLKSVPSLKRREINNNVKVNEPFFLGCWDRSMRFHQLRIDKIGVWDVPGKHTSWPSRRPSRSPLPGHPTRQPWRPPSWRRPSSLAPRCGPGHVVSRGQAAAREAPPRGPHRLRRKCSRAAWLVRATAAATKIAGGLANYFSFLFLLVGVGGRVRVEL